MTNSTHCSLLEDYLNAALDSKHQESFRAHLIDCKTCSELVAEWTFIRQDLQQSFGGMHLDDETRRDFLQTVQLESEQRRKTAPRAFAIAASVLLVGTIVMSWQFSQPVSESSDPTAIVSKQYKQTSSESDSSPVFANAVFDQDTIAVLECDEDEFTVYRIFPNVTLRSLE